MSSEWTDTHSANGTAHLAMGVAFQTSAAMKKVRGGSSIAEEIVAPSRGRSISL
jgi:hypothetical protein